MTDPEENTENTKKELESEKKQGNDTSAEAGRKGNASTHSNWNEHMQIDEEGNEVSPDDQ